MFFILVSPNTFAQYYKRGMLEGHTEDVNSIAFSRNGEMLASGSSDSTIRLWDALIGTHKRTLRGHWYSVISVAFSPNGRTLASGSWDDTIRLWDAATGAHKRTLRGHTFPVSSVAFSPNGRVLASGSWDDTIRLWDTVTGTHKRTLEGHADWVWSVAFSPDGRTLASGSSDRTVRLWDAVTGAQVRMLRGHTNSVTSVAFSPDGGTLASAGEDKTVRLWNGMTGARKRILRGHTDWVWSVAFSPDSRTLASGSNDETVRLWDAVTGAQVQVLQGHTSGVTSVAFSSDDRTLASGDNDGRVYLWESAPVFDTDATVSVIPASMLSPTVGGRLTLFLAIAAGENVAGYQATVEFDASALRYIGSRNGDYLRPGAFAAPTVASRNKVRLAAASLLGESNGGGTLARLTFEVVTVKMSTLRLSEVVLSDSAGRTSRPRVEGGQVVRSPRFAADVNGDGAVNIKDLVHVASKLGQTGQNDADVNGDSVVNIADLVLVAGVVGNTAAAPSAWYRNLEIVPTRAQVTQWLDQARGLALTDAISQRGVGFLENLLAALTPRETVLLPNYPNPFNPETWMPYRLATDGDVQISIYDSKGDLVRQLDLGRQPAGFYTGRGRAAYWDGRNKNAESVTSGAYFYQLRAGDYMQMRRMVVVK